MVCKLYGVRKGVSRNEKKTPYCRLDTVSNDLNVFVNTKGFVCTQWVIYNPDDPAKCPHYKFVEELFDTPDEEFPLNVELEYGPNGFISIAKVVK